MGYFPTLMMPEKIAIHVKRGIQKVLHINKALDRMYVEPQQLFVLLWRWLYNLQKILQEEGF